MNYLGLCFQMYLCAAVILVCEHVSGGWSVILGVKSGCTAELRLLEAGRWVDIIQGFLTLTAGQELGDLLENIIRGNPGSLGIINNKALNPEDPINTQCVFKSIKV